MGDTSPNHSDNSQHRKPMIYQIGTWDLSGFGSPDAEPDPKAQPDANNANNTSRLQNKATQRQHTDTH